MDFDFDEDTRAANTWVHVVWYVYSEEDSWGNDVSWGVPVTMHATREAADADLATRSGPAIPDGNDAGRWVCAERANLLAFVLSGFATAEQARALFRDRKSDLDRRVWYAPGYYHAMFSSVPLTLDEVERATKLKVWSVYYEDRFHVGANRESYPVAVCLTEEDAEAEVKKRGPIVSGGDGYLSSGPYPLVSAGKRTSEYGADTVREVLRRAASGERGVVAMK